jgi:hypothetical protein
VAPSVRRCTSPSDTAAYGASIAGLPDLDASGFLVTTAPCGMNVAATYSYASLVLPAILLRAGACYPHWVTRLAGPIR